MLSHRQIVLIDAIKTPVHVYFVTQRYNRDSRACADVHMFYNAYLIYVGVSY